MKLDRIRIVLVEPTHPGNIGAVARAIKTMGLHDLCLVNARKYPHYEASKRAAGAEDVLDAAIQMESLAEAVADCTSVMGTSVRDREVSWPTLDPRQAANEVSAHLQQGADNRVAVLFGRESSGLTNQELEFCQMQIRIPANPEYSSLNLASAVQLICYELHMSARSEPSVESDSDEPTPAQKRRQAASRAQLDGHLAHLQQVLQQLDFVKSKPPTLLMRKLTRLYNKANLSVEEVQILRGILAAIEEQGSRS